MSACTFAACDRNREKERQPPAYPSVLLHLSPSCSSVKGIAVSQISHTHSSDFAAESSKREERGKDSSDILVGMRAGTAVPAETVPFLSLCVLLPHRLLPSVKTPLSLTLFHSIPSCKQTHRHDCSPFLPHHHPLLLFFFTSRVSSLLFSFLSPATSSRNCLLLFPIIIDHHVHPLDSILLPTLE